MHSLVSDLTRRSALMTLIGLSISACGKSGSNSGPSDPGATRAEAIDLLKSPTFGQSNGRVHRWPSGTIPYRVDGDAALKAAASGGASYWSRVLAGLAAFVETTGTANVVVRYADRGSCGRADYTTNGRGVIGSGQVTIRPDGQCRIDAVLLAHELGHTLALNHTASGIMAPTASSLDEGPHALFEALRILYENPPGTRFA